MTYEEWTSGQNKPTIYYLFFNFRTSSIFMQLFNDKDHIYIVFTPGITISRLIILISEMIILKFIMKIKLLLFLLY